MTNISHSIKLIVLLISACYYYYHSINGPPGLDRLLSRSRRRWRCLVLTFLQWYKDNLLCLFYTDKSQALLLAISVHSLTNKEGFNTVQDEIKCFPGCSESFHESCLWIGVAGIPPAQPWSLFSRWQVRTGREMVMFLWVMSNTRGQAKFKTRLLLVARLVNANCIFCILSRLLLPSFNALALHFYNLSFPHFSRHFGKQ